MFLSLLDLLRQAGQEVGDLSLPASQMEIMDEGQALRFKAHLPGIDPKSVQVGLGESSLSIYGHSTCEERTEAPDFYRVQASAGSFFRTLPLPARVNPHGAALEWQSGDMLVIRIPKQ